jgi:hypothetical protein
MSKRQGLEVLNRRQCLIFCKSGAGGSSGFTEDACLLQPELPLWRDDVVIRAARRGLLAAAVTTSSWRSRLMSWIQTCAQGGV